MMNILRGQKGTTVLEVADGRLRLLNDEVTDSYSIGLTTCQDFQWKHISKELHDLLVKELTLQEGSKFK